MFSVILSFLFYVLNSSTSLSVYSDYPAWSCSAHLLDMSRWCFLSSGLLETSVLCKRTSVWEPWKHKHDDVCFILWQYDSILSALYRSPLYKSLLLFKIPIFSVSKWKIIYPQAHLYFLLFLNECQREKCVCMCLTCSMVVKDQTVSSAIISIPFLAK